MELHRLSIRVSACATSDATNSTLVIVALYNGPAGVSQVTASVLLWDALLTEQRKSSFFYGEFVREHPDTTKQRILPAKSVVPGTSQPSSVSVTSSADSTDDWLHMDAAGREVWAAKVVEAAVMRTVGTSVGLEKPLMSAGVDSLGTLPSNIGVQGMHIHLFPRGIQQRDIAAMHG